MFYPNKTISITRGDTYATSVTTGLRVYIYEQSDDLSIVNDIDGWQDQLKMLTKYSNIAIGDKLVDQDNVVYIVKKVTPRISMIRKFYEVIVRKKND